MSSPRDRKLVLAVQDPALAERLRGLLSGDGVEIAHVPELASARPDDVDADVVVLRASGLDEDRLPEVLTSAQDETTPGVVVLSDDGTRAEEVELVAAGASAVFDIRGTKEALAEQLVELAEAEAEGGLQGPDHGGAVAEPKLADFQSRSPRMRDFLDVVKRVATSDCTLLVTGETGVGKERLARGIHAESGRSEGPFVSVNCGALNENLLESELFGHERGAFTGATDRRDGRFVLANGGTIFLDEIAEMPQHLQVKLLTVLQRHEVQPLGARSPVRIDVRVIAATNRDLSMDVEEGRFREDLYFRLNVVSLAIPPLRERIEDVPWFLGRFLRHFSELHDKPSVVGIEPEALDRLVRYRWPGNVRELINVVERAVLLCERPRIGLDELTAEVTARTSEPGATAPSAADELYALPLQSARRSMLDRFEREYLSHHLRESGGVLADVAARAAINPRTLYEKMRRLGLRKEDFR